MASGAAHESNQGLHGSLQTDGEENGGRVWGRRHYLYVSLGREGASLVAQTVKRLPTMQETHSSILAWKIP